MEMQRSGRPPVGTALVLPHFGPVRVAGNDDPSLVALETATGARFRIGERALRDLLAAERQAA